MKTNITLKLDSGLLREVKILAAEIGLGERQGQKYLAELERARMIRRVQRFQQRAQTSNEFEFLWHEMFIQGVNDRSGEGVNDHSPPPPNYRSPRCRKCRAKGTRKRCWFGLPW